MDRCTETASLISFETFQVDRDVRINVKTPPVMSKRYGFQYHVLVISGMLVKKPRFWDLNAELQAVGMCLCYSPREFITVWINTLFGFLNQLTQRLPKWLWLMDVDNEWIPTPPPFAGDAVEHEADTLTQMLEIPAFNLYWSPLLYHIEILIYWALFYIFYLTFSI